MDFARQQRDPKRHLVGLGAVVVFHLLVIYGLMTGLAQKAIEVVKKPISATIVEEIKKPPPPPPPPPTKIEIPKAAAPPPPAYVPPPDIPPPPQVIEAPVITTTPTPPPPEPYVIQPPPPPVIIAPPAPPPPPPKPAFRVNPARVSGEMPTFPARALRERVYQGRVVAHFTVDEKGNVIEVKIVSSDPPRMFDGATRDAIMTWKFPPGEMKWVGEQELSFVAN
jgi:protein TonB